MIVYKVAARFADAEDEDAYQAERAKHRTPPPAQEIESSDRVTFQPPLYIQRYAKVVEICKEHQFERVADLGCAELTFVQYLKNLDFITQILAVDIDRALLETHKHRCKPLMFEYLNPRMEPMNITVLCGSVLEPDPRLTDLDCITAIELIEHIPAADTPTFTENIFGRLRPRHAVITTPNSDFNVLFEFRPGQMRHWDHRFEWSQAEFGEWCEGVSEGYGYEYELVGIGEPPPGSEGLGCCSQGALFTRSEERTVGVECVQVELDNSVAELEQSLQSTHLTDQSGDTTGSPTVDQTTEPLYELLYTVDYPVRPPSLTPEVELQNELVYVCRMVGLKEYEDEGWEESSIPISHLQDFPSIAQYSPTTAQIVELAEKGSVLTVSADRLNINIINIPPSPEPRSENEEEYEGYIFSDHQEEGEEEVW